MSQGSTRADILENLVVEVVNLHSSAEKIINSPIPAPDVFFDRLAGTIGSDHIEGKYWAEFIRGNAGDDIIGGGAGNNSILGDAGNDILRGDNGNDTLNGGADVNHLFGGKGDDTFIVTSKDIIVEFADEGVDTAIYMDSGTFRTPQNVENILIRNGQAANAVGNQLDNYISGSAAANILVGADGADTILGGGGNDRLLGGEGDNSMVGGAGDDFVNGEAGNDNVDGSDGNDTLLGLSGDDVILGRSGADQLFGGDGNDQLSGGSGNDILVGGTGADTLEGGEGIDVLSGGEGADVFLFSSVKTAERDIVTDFQTGIDRIGISSQALDQWAEQALHDSSLATYNGASTFPDGGRFAYSNDTGVLWYDADGVGPEKAEMVAVLRGAPELVLSDIFLY